MQSGPYNAFVKRLSDGWWCMELTGNSYCEYGPYRWRWQALFTKWMIAP